MIMEERDADLWWDVVQVIVQKDIGKVSRMYEKHEKLSMHKISQMGKVIPLFHYELLVLILEPETLYEEEKKGQTKGA